MNRNTRVLGLDHGEKRIGVAISDPLHITAQSLGYIENKGQAYVHQAIREYNEQYMLSKIVVGLPIKLDGSDTPQTKKVRAFVEQLEELNIPVELYDERLTSVSAENMLISAGMRRDKRKQKIDGLAAQIMLQTFMDTHKHD